jgi:hypothetical protein
MHLVQGLKYFIVKISRYNSSLVSPLVRNAFGCRCQGLVLRFNHAGCLIEPAAVSKHLPRKEQRQQEGN